MNMFVQIVVLIAESKHVKVCICDDLQFFCSCSGGMSGFDAMSECIFISNF